MQKENGRGVNGEDEKKDRKKPLTSEELLGKVWPVSSSGGRKENCGVLYRLALGLRLRRKGRGRGDS